MRQSALLKPTASSEKKVIKIEYKIPRATKVKNKAPRPKKQKSMHTTNNFNFTHSENQINE